MTACKPSLPLAPDAAQTATNASPNDGQARHSQAMQHPAPGFERALVTLLRGWQEYAHAYRVAYDEPIYAADILGEDWAQIGSRLLCLFNGPRGRLDDSRLKRTVLDRKISADASAEFTTGADVPDPVAEKDDTSERDPRIGAFSRADALAHGVLVDATFEADKAGYQTPVALSRVLWDDIRAIPERLQIVTSCKSRLWDVLRAGRNILVPQGDANWYRYSLDMPVGEAQQYEVQAHYDLDEEGKRVLTLMQPGERW